MSFLIIRQPFQHFHNSLASAWHPIGRNLVTRVPIRAYSSLRGKETEKLLSGVSRENYDIGRNVLEKASRALDYWTLERTDFLTPPAQMEMMNVLSRVADVSSYAIGGYQQAERCRIGIGRAENFDETSFDQSEVVAALRVLGNFSFDKVSHGDFLGAILGSGVKREKVGDIIVFQDDVSPSNRIQGAEIIVDPELVDFFKLSLTQVRTTPVVVEQISLSDLHVKPPKVTVMNTVEASLRLDAVASAGFRISRTKMGDLISSGNVNLNFKVAAKAGVNVKTGDIISSRGMGRLKVGVVNVTKKGKYSIEVERYV